MISFGRMTIFCLGTIIILAVCYYSRINFWLHAKFTTGTVTNSVIIKARYDNDSYDEVEFSLDSTEYFFKGQSILHYPQLAKVPVIYNPINPGDAKIFTLLGFWSMPLAWSLIPIFLLYAIIFSFWSSSDVITIGSKREN